jgi:hypothetical protein
MAVCQTDGGRVTFRKIASASSDATAGLSSTVPEVYPKDRCIYVPTELELRQLNKSRKFSLK